VLWHDLFLFCLWFGLFGTILAGHVLLARHGQTIGLALVRLHWWMPAGRPAARRLLGEPQFWCASGPALYFTLLMLLTLLLSTGPAWAVYGRWFPWVLCVALVISAVVVMVRMRGSPGHRVADASVARRTRTW